MKRLKDIHITKKKLGIGIAGLAVLAAVLVLPPAAEKVSAISAANTERKLPIYCVQTDEPKVSVSFDAAWGNEDTQKILDILKKHDIHVTFFMTGGWVESNPDDVKAI